MIQITPHMRILLAVQPVDLRKGIDGLAAVCRSVMGANPLSGTLFVFHNRRRTAIRTLSYDGQGYWMCQKRLSHGRWKWWPGRAQETVRRLAVHELQLLLWNGDPASARVAPMWRSISEEGSEVKKTARS